MTVATRRAWDGGFQVEFDTSNDGFDPAIVDPPTPRAEQVIVGQVIDSVTQNGTQFTPAVRTQPKKRQHYRILVGGKDVTYFRGVQTPMPTYGLESPLLYGSGQITFPQIHAAYERPGISPLKWLKKFATVKIQRRDTSDGHIVATDYIGFIADFQHDGHQLTCTLGGQASGRAAMQDRETPIFPRSTDIGRQLMLTMRNRVRVSIANSPTTGIQIPTKGGMGQLDWITETLAMSTERDGTQWTIMPNARGRYRMFQKDTTTIDATVYIDGDRAVQSLRRDFTEELNRVWATAVGPDGLRIRYAVFPGLASGDRPAFHGTLSPGDTGDDVLVVIWRLWYVGRLSPVVLEWTTSGDDPITAAIKDLQDDNGLSVTGAVNEATWNILFDPSGSGYGLAGSRVLPAAQIPRVNPYLRTATGQIRGPNPHYNRTIPWVDGSVDLGQVDSSAQGRRWSKRELADPDTSNWVGTVTVNTGAVIDGEHNPGDPLDTTMVRDARSIKPGMNLWLTNWDGGTRVHVSGVQVTAGSVEFTVDTQARDTMKVWEIRRRSKEARQSPARQWIAQHRRSGTRDDTGAFYDGKWFGKVPQTFCPADTWTTIPTPAGREGMIQILDVQTDNTKALFGLSIWGKEPPKGWLNQNLGDPLGTPYAKRVRRHTKQWQDNRWLVNIWGQKDQPCGYWPDQLDPNAFNLVTQTGATVNSASDTFSLAHHGYSNGDRVYFSAGSLPAGLTADNDYYVVQATAGTFKVSASRGGSPMNITADRSGVSVSVHVADTPDVTGQFRDKSGFPYFCVGAPVLWVAIRPDRDTWLQGGRILELLLDDAAG